MILAEDSDSADVTAELVDVGVGGSDRDYAGKNVRGKLVLLSGPLTDAAALAIDKYGAKGMLSDMPNQVTAWWKEDVNLIRWGHLDAFEARHTFAFMLSSKQANGLARTPGRRRAHHAARDRARGPARVDVQPGHRAHPRLRFARRGDRAELPPRPSAPRRERQRERLRDDSRGRPHHREAHRRRKDRSSVAQHSLRVAVRGGVHHGALQRRAGDARALQGGGAHGHGGRRAGDQGRVPRQRKSAQPADLRERCGSRLRRLRERGIGRVRGGSRREVSARVGGGRQGAARGRAGGVQHGERQRAVHGGLVSHSVHLHG